MCALCGLVNTITAQVCALDILWSKYYRVGVWASQMLTFLLQRTVLMYFQNDLICFPPPSFSLSVVCPPQASTPAGKVSPKDEERKDESPSSWRMGLRKTGSYGALAEISTTKEAQKEKDTAGVMRSASSPRLSSSLDNKDKEKVYLIVVV